MSGPLGEARSGPDRVELVVQGSIPLGELSTMVPYQLVGAPGPVLAHWLDAAPGGRRAPAGAGGCWRVPAVLRLPEGNGWPRTLAEGPADAGAAKGLVCGADRTG